MRDLYIERSRMDPHLLIIRDRNDQSSPLCWYDPDDREFVKLDYKSSQRTLLDGVSLGMPEHIISECLAYSITGKLKGET